MVQYKKHAAREEGKKMSKKAKAVIFAIVVLFLIIIASGLAVYKLR